MTIDQRAVLILYAIAGRSTTGTASTASTYASVSKDSPTPSAAAARAACADHSIWYEYSRALISVSAAAKLLTKLHVHPCHYGAVVHPAWRGGSRVLRRST